MGRAIVRNPQVFLFDEPLSNLDAKLRVQMRAEIKDLHQRLKVTTVYVTHDQIEAMTMADKIVAMSEGNVEQIGSPLDLYDHPTNLFVAGFIGSPAMNLLKGEIVGDQFHTEGGMMLPLPKGMGSRKAVYGIRPEYIRLQPEGGIDAKVHLVEPMGSETQVTVRLGETPLVCTFRERVNARPGDVIRIMPDRAVAHVFDAENRQPDCDELENINTNDREREEYQNNHRENVMQDQFTRRGALGLGVSAAALSATGASAQSTIKAADVPAPDFKIESGAKLRMLRPVKFVQPDEDIFRANAKRFTDKTGVEMKVDFVGWEDINQQTAVTSNSGAGPDLIMGFSDAPHIYADKLIELTDVADYLGKRYGGWLTMAQRYGKKHGRNSWIGIPFGASSGPLIYRKSILKRSATTRSGRHAGRSRAVQETEGGRQAGRLCARQRGRRRQRLRQLDPVVAWRLAAGREGRGHHQLQGDDRGAALSEGAVSDLHSGHDRPGTTSPTTAPIRPAKSR